jgi:hypothetical protein
MSQKDDGIDEFKIFLSGSYQFEPLENLLAPSPFE